MPPTKRGNAGHPTHTVVRIGSKEYIHGELLRATRFPKFVTT